MSYSVTEVGNAILATIKQNAASKPLYTFTLPQALGNFPALALEPVGANFVVDMKGASEVWEFIVYVVANGANFDTAKAHLSRYCSGHGPDSIREIIENNSDLGLEDVTAMVHSVSGYNGKFPWSNVNHLAAALLVRVYIF